MRKYLYYLLKEDGRSGKVVNNVVTFSGVPTPLPQTPDGWQEITIAWERSLSDHGLLRNFTLPFGFVRDGAKIIRDALYNQSIEEKLFLLIQTLTVVFVPGVSYNWLYSYLYKGELDLSAAEDEQDIISVPCLEGGLHKLLKANRNTKYTFPFDLDAVTVNLEGITLLENANYVVTGPIDSDVYLDNHTAPIAFINKEGLSTGTAFFSQTIDNFPLGTETASSNYFIVNNSGAAVTYTLRGTIFIMCTEKTGTFNYRLQLRKNDGTNTIVYDTPSDISIGETLRIEVDETFTLNDTERMFLLGRFFGTGQITLDYISTSELNLTFESTAEPAFVKAYTKDVLYRKLIKEVCGDESYASSDLCEQWKHIVLASGDSIRRIPNATITTSLDDFFEDMDSTFMAGIGVENDLVKLEGREYFYDTTTPIDLGNVKDFVKTPATDLICNKFKFGHVKPDIEDINGKYDPNGSCEFTGPVTKVVKEYKAISPYKASPYEISSLRLNLDGKVTTDDNRDNDVYVIHCLPLVPISATVTFNSAGYFTITSSEGLAEGQQIQISGSASNDGIYNILSIGSIIVAQLVSISGTIVNESAVAVTITILRGGVYELNRPAYTTLDGVPNNTIFNLPNLTPKALLLAHGRWIRSMHYGLDTLKIKFNSGDKNTALLTELAGVTIDEDADVEIASLGDPLFLPFYFNFGLEVPTDLVDVLEDTPNQCFKFTDEEGNEFTGFLMSAGMAPNDLKEQEFKLLAAPNNDLTLLAA